MKEYVIHCNEEQLRLLKSAVELQMRTRIGQGFAIIENLCYGDADFRDKFEAYDSILNEVLNKIVVIDYCHTRKSLDNTHMTERDMWIGLENALGFRIGETGLSDYGLLKVDKVRE